MAIRYENKDDIPQTESGDFVEWQEKNDAGESTTVYLHKDYAGALREQYRLQGDVTKLTEDNKTTKQRLEELSAAERKRAEEAEEERRKGMTEVERLQEQLDDAVKRIDETEAQYKKRLADIEADKREASKRAVVAKIGGFATEQNRTILERMASADLEMAEDGTWRVLGPDGKATSQTLEDYEASIKDRYPSLVKAVSSRGGKGNGGGTGSEGGNNYGANIPGFSDLPKN